MHKSNNGGGQKKPGVGWRRWIVGKLWKHLGSLEHPHALFGVKQQPPQGFAVHRFDP